jgi:hypothetical protein
MAYIVQVQEPNVQNVINHHFAELIKLSLFNEAIYRREKSYRLACCLASKNSPSGPFTPKYQNHCLIDNSQFHEPPTFCVWLWIIASVHGKVSSRGRTWNAVHEFCKKNNPTISDNRFRIQLRQFRSLALMKFYDSAHFECI